MLNWNHECCDCLRNSKVELQPSGGRNDWNCARSKFHVVVRVYNRQPNSHDELLPLTITSGTCIRRVRICKQCIMVRTKQDEAIQDSGHDKVRAGHEQTIANTAK
jgi:hypothetical protein